MAYQEDDMGFYPTSHPTGLSTVVQRPRKPRRLRHLQIRSSLTQLQLLDKEKSREYTVLTSPCCGYRRAYGNSHVWEDVAMYGLEEPYLSFLKTPEDASVFLNWENEKQEEL
ncbi:hypothetical protein P7K49_037816 [Saguinus oedipus]|uniref:Uncharacterized protein n=1 Tax=Saguinus oedipus TaxID=9490 RepID=A0ABQ9TJ60_SAGOE|nr:hypothetical protein P7K49_037816 [Saguinus oedipus]